MQRIVIAVILLCCVVIIGTGGYILIQKWNLLDSLYMTIITIGTVGFHEVRELSYVGRIFTIALIIFGIGIGGYTIANLSAFIIEGHIQNLFRGRKMEKEISRLKDHIIVCGYGNTGVETVDELVKSTKQFVVIENDDQSEELELKIEEVKLHKGSLLENKLLKESNIKAETDGATVIGINKKAKKIIVNPPGNTVLEDEDILFVLGNDSQIEKLKQLAEV